MAASPALPILSAEPIRASIAAQKLTVRSTHPGCPLSSPDGECRRDTYRLSPYGPIWERDAEAWSLAPFGASNGASLTSYLRRRPGLCMDFISTRRYVNTFGVGRNGEAAVVPAEPGAPAIKYHR